jgi:CDP-glucose 4,6-dehydratase
VAIRKSTLVSTVRLVTQNHLTFKNNSIQSVMDFTNLQTVYSNKKVFITGHTGFKGSWLLQWLHLLGAEIKGYALYPEYEEGLYNLIDGDSLCESVIADILEKEKLEEAILNFEPDFIFHLAAQPLVRLSYEIPSETFEVNAMGTAYVLEAVRKLQKPCIVILITTDKVYENKEWLYPYRETDALGGYDPYSASKACAEIIIHSYIQSYFNKNDYNKHKKVIASTRAGNVIGGGDWSKDRIVPDIIKSLNNKQPVSIRNPSAIRPWQHVLEPLGGYLQLGTKMTTDPIQYTGAWNFGPLADDNKTVEELVQICLKCWGNGNYEKPALNEQVHEAGLLKLDISKASSCLNWLPKYKASKAIEETILWYREFYRQRKEIKRFTINQIISYQNHEQTTMG